jgi:uncharacterized membrane protein required for colicin V production
MLIDILLGIPMLLFILLGLRDGIVRKLVAIVVFIAALFVGQMYMHDLGQFLSENGWIQSTDASAYGYLIIFFGMAILQGLLYKLIAHGYKIGGLADRVGGMIFGCIEGALFLSILLLIFAQTGFPSRETKRDSRFYKPIVNIAPQILDLTSSLGPDSFEKIKDLGTSGAIDSDTKVHGIHGSIDSSAVMDKRKQLEKLNDARETARKQNSE